MPTKYKRTHHRRKNKHNRTIKRRTAKSRGGLFGAVRGAINSGDIQNKPGQENTSYKTAVKKGGVFSKGTIYNLEYISPNNYLIFRDPNSKKTPRFQVHIGTGPAIQAFIRIANPNNPKDIKFIEYFICVDGNWYCMMRVFGINTGVFATATNTLFYKIPNKWFDLTKNKITIPKEATIMESLSDLNIIQRGALLNDKGSIMRINPKYYEIVTGDIFYALRQFRNAQLINYDVKQEMAEEGAKLGVEALVGVAKMAVNAN